ncbi:ABC transporter ATP-binding protein [soil metagenome]
MNFTDNILEVDGLKVRFQSGKSTISAVEDVSFSVRKGETLAIVGESGCGKSVSSLALMGLLPERTATVSANALRFTLKNGEQVNLLDLSAAEQRRLRGDEMAMIFQEPMTSLNPMHSVGDQIAEAVCIHRNATRAEARVVVLEMMRLVGISDAEARLKALPHELSGGMRQRIMIAMALVCRPNLLIADEPTTALDVTIQAQILDLIRTLRDEIGMAVLFITHDLGVVAEIADNVLVMYAGQVVERGTVRDILQSPQHPYTQGLLRSLPETAPMDGDQHELYSIPGTVPDLSALPSGCRFHPRCGEFVMGVCDRQMVPLEVSSTTHAVRCLMRTTRSKYDAA